VTTSPQDDSLPLLALHERARYRAAADYALRRYPGPVGELIHRVNVTSGATVDEVSVLPGDRSPALVPAVAVVQRRWTLLVVEALLRRGPLRFVDVRRELQGISPNVLSQRLRELAADGVVARGRLPAPAASRVYELTDRGHGLAPVLRELRSWALLDSAAGSAREV
jgi:DNA-binding HxlR family transcriptional regulator